MRAYNLRGETLRAARGATGLRLHTSVMGIQGLMKLICDYSPSSVKDHAIKNYFGKMGRACTLEEAGSNYRNLVNSDIGSLYGKKCSVTNF